MLNLRDRKFPGRFHIAGGLLLGCALLCTSLANAAQMDNTGPPPAGDSSVLTDPTTANLATLPPTNIGSFLGGATGTAVDTEANVVITSAASAALAGRAIDAPTGGQPSPLFGAQPFTQRMLLFEEFGPEPLDPNLPPPPNPFPSLSLGPDAMEAFLAQPGIAPFPTRLSNTVDQNPWKPEIATFLGRLVPNAPAEGRPPGVAFAHQRWNEFYPQIFFKTVQTGARVNGGFRDTKQMHGYSVGEFAPGGLYNQVYTSTVPGAPTLNGTTKGIAVRFHPLMPIQDPKALWTFDGTVPPKLLMARNGQTVMMRHYNGLPIDPAANMGFGTHTITTHEHNGHTPAESDGYTNAFFFPGQYYDYRWPLQLAGYDTINTSAKDIRAAFPCAPGETLIVNNDPTASAKPCVNGSINIRGDWRETMSTHWFHDHMLDFTAQNVYKGNAAMMNYYSALDRGNESVNDGVNLKLPSGTALPWGNRDYDINLLVADKAWDPTGQLMFNIFNSDGFIGDQLLVNWVWKPYEEVRARRYRFRILNGSVSRFLAIGLVQKINGPGGEIPGNPITEPGITYHKIPFHMVANDGNIMEHTVAFDTTTFPADPTHQSILPTQGIAERYDIVVDFGAANGLKDGDTLYFVNTLEHINGKVTGNKIPLATILSGAYNPVVQTIAGVPQWTGGDPCVGKFMEFRVKAYAGIDQSMNPADFVAGKQALIPLTIDRATLPASLANVRHRSFGYGHANAPAAPNNNQWTVDTDAGLGFNMDPRRLSAAMPLSTGPTEAGAVGDGTLEIWKIALNGNGWSHPVHIHFEEGIMLSRGGVAPPPWETWARKDVYRIGIDADSTSQLEFAIHFREFSGSYMQHCHNTQHEDNSMLLRWDIERPGQFQLMATPLPTWDGVNYTPSQGLPTFRTGDGSGVNKVGPVLPAPVLPALVITSATSPSNGATQTITGVVQLGTPPPVVTATGTAVVGPVTVNGSLWSCKLSGLPPGDTTITATVNVGGATTTRTSVITVIPPDGNLKLTGTPDISDALRAMRIAVGLVQPTFNDILHGDVAPVVNGASAPDGKIDVSDALLILNKSVGLP